MSLPKTTRWLLLAAAGAHLAWTSAAQELPATTGPTNPAPALNTLPTLVEKLLSDVITQTPPASERPAQEVAPTPPPALVTSIEADEIIGDRQVQHALLSFGTNAYSFIIPELFHVESSSPDKLVIVNQGYDCFLTVRLVEPASGDLHEPDMEACRRRLLDSYAYAKISEEYQRSIANHSGPAFDFTWQNSGGGVAAGRMIFIRTAAGILEFSFRTGTDQFTVGEHAFNSIVLTFRTNEKGALEVARIAEKA